MSRSKYSGWRKPRPVPIHPDKNPWSSQARAIGKLINHRRYAEALTQLNGLLTGVLTGSRQAEILAFAADVSFAQGKFDQAKTTYNQAAGLAQGTLDGWVRPALGRVRALLKAVQVPEAQAAADALLSLANTRWQAYRQALAQAQSAGAAGLPVTVPAQPPRPSVIASRLARQFFDEGELALSKTFWQQALVIEPLGATKARLGLAEVALREDRVADAVASAVDALQVGKFQKKTLAAWPLLLKANARLGLNALDANLLNGLSTVKASVRARAVQIIARTLYAQNNPLWTALVEDWLSGNPPQKFAAIKSELQKLLLANERRRTPSDPARCRSLARDAAQVSSLSPAEMLAVIKEQVRAGYKLGIPADWVALVDAAVARFGEGVRFRLMHGVARVYISELRPDLARPILQTVVTSGPRTAGAWSRAVAALARLEAAAGNHDAAANYYQLVGQDLTVSARFRVQCKVRWVQELIAADRGASLEAVGSEIVAGLSQVQDYNLLLDCAQHLNSSGRSLRAHAESLYNRGSNLARQALQGTSHPEEFLRILYKLTLRQSDLGYTDEVCRLWETQVSAKAAWLWSEKSEFWLYLGLVVRAFRRNRKPVQSDALAASYLTNPSTTSEGYAVIGTRYGLYKIYGGEVDAALGIFAKVISKAPTSVYATYAFYWLAISEWTKGNIESSKAHAKRIRLAVKPGTKVGWELDMLARSMCFEADLLPGQLPNRSVEPTLARMQTELGEVKRDFAAMTAN